MCNVLVGAAQSIDSRIDMDCDRVADVLMQRTGSQRYKASLLHPVAAPTAVDSRSNSCDSNRDSIANGVDEVVTPTAVVFTPAASQQQPHCFIMQQSADQMNPQPQPQLQFSQLAAGAQFEPNPETGTCDGEDDDLSHQEEYSQRSSASKTHNRKVRILNSVYCVYVRVHNTILYNVHVLFVVMLFLQGNIGKYTCLLFINFHSLLAFTESDAVAVAARREPEDGDLSTADGIPLTGPTVSTALPASATAERSSTASRGGQQQRDRRHYWRPVGRSARRVRSRRASRAQCHRQ